LNEASFRKRDFAKTAKNYFIIYLITLSIIPFPLNNIDLCPTIIDFSNGMKTLYGLPLVLNEASFRKQDFAKRAENN
jgi:hypothetical protein